MPAAPLTILSANKMCIRDSPTNWRSCRAIVETNNTLFRQLSETATAKAVLSAMLPKDTPSALLAAILGEGAPVSYTHLDVYKRQALHPENGPPPASAAPERCFRKLVVSS